MPAPVDPDFLLVEDPSEASTVLVSFAGGGSGAGGGSQQVYVQDDPPVVPAGVPYLWWETGLAPGGTGFTLWFSDGTP